MGILLWKYLVLKLCALQEISKLIKGLCAEILSHHLGSIAKLWCFGVYSAVSRCDPTAVDDFQVNEAY